MIKKIVAKLPIEEFLASESASGFLLGLCTVVALILANSELYEVYDHFLHLGWGGFSVHLFVNDALMAIFFFVVGMEIKRELIIGELSQLKKAIFPIAAAVGGMAVPALIYLAINPNYPLNKGWGIPMATDIAFAIGVLSFLGKRISLSLKVFLLALAIVDDLGAVAVIAFFYTEEIKWIFLFSSLVAFVCFYFAFKLKIQFWFIYLAIAVAAWFLLFKSGVHATIAGVLLGFIVPTDWVLMGAKVKPLEWLVHKLHPWVNFLIMPIFALVNAGVRFVGQDFLQIKSHPIYMGVFLGLLLGKPVGIFLLSRTLVLFKFAELPRGTNWWQILGMGFLGGIGFTMALFVSGLALYPEQELFSKLAILTASATAALVGVAVLFFSTKAVKN